MVLGRKRLEVVRENSGSFYMGGQKKKQSLSAAQFGRKKKCLKKRGAREDQLILAGLEIGNICSQQTHGGSPFAVREESGSWSLGGQGVYVFQLKRNQPGGCNSTPS